MRSISCSTFIVVLTGSLAYDYILNFNGQFSDYILADKLHQINISFTTEEFRREFGGTAGNQAFNLSLLRTPFLLLGSVGYDFGDYTKHLDKNNIKTDYIAIDPHKPTASGFVITDIKNNQIWSFGKGAMKEAKNLSLKNIKEKISFVVVSPNEPEAMTKMVDESIKDKIPFLYDPAFYIPVFDKMTLEKGCRNCLILIGNDYEMAMIKKKINFKQDKKQIIITTLGEKGSIIQQGKKKIFISPAKPKNTCDPTGAGDAYRAGFLAGFVKGFDLKTCGQMGSLTAVYTVEKYGTQTHWFTLKDFVRRYRQNYRESLVF